MKRLRPARLVAAFLLAGPAGLCSSPAAESGPRPNILWITSEDHGPDLGCYGDPLATTPNADRLARMGLRYTFAWSCAPVCAPARTALISGLYPNASGGEHMRSLAPYPAGKPMFPQLLRTAGYYCSNNSKEDYNLAAPGQVWDESSGRAHWRNRAPGQPFFAVFNSMKSHEAQLRARPHLYTHDPAAVRVPPYHPDTPEVRRDWAQYYDQVTAADADAGQILHQLEEDGLLGDTIIFHFADHGSGMPRHKRMPYNTGLRVPLLVYIPEKFQHLRPPGYQAGGTSDRLVSFVDFAPTVLSLASLRPPDWMQGQAFLGTFRAPAPAWLFGDSARMDERLDLIRSVTDGRYVYVRNFMPHKPGGQHNAYMFETPTTRVWHDLFVEGKLNPVQAAFWQPKPPEELYDLEADPDEVNNLAQSPAHQRTKRRLHDALRQHLTAIRDVSFLPEGQMHLRAAGASPYDYARLPAAYPFPRVLETAELAAGLEPEAGRPLRRALADPDSAVRWWAALGFVMRGPEATLAARTELQHALDDPAPEVRIATAEALARHAGDSDRAPALELLVSLADAEHQDVFTAVAALNALDELGEKARPVATRIRALPVEGPVPDPRFQKHVAPLVEQLRERFR